LQDEVLDDTKPWHSMPLIDSTSFVTSSSLPNEDSGKLNKDEMRICSIGFSIVRIQNQVPTLEKHHENADLIVCSSTPD
jgi:hypothetical protein